MNSIADHVTFNDTKLGARYSQSRIPMSTLFEAYFDGAVDIPDIDALLDARDLFVRYSLTGEHLKFFLTRFIPEVAIHSKSQDERIVREHYDRGDPFFRAFLGERMVYTCAYFDRGPGSSLEEAQDDKMDLVCKKLMLEPGETLLDVGCGWGTLIRHAAQRFGVDATGVTISKNQSAFGNERIEGANVQDRARVLCLDYREIPERTYAKIVSLEMVEHVGIKNFSKFCQQMYRLLRDDGLLLLQWTGLRRGLRPEDLIWGLFMSKYIFPGADASLPLSNVVRGLEKVGFEVHSVENISPHYAMTIHTWHQNWCSSKEEIVRQYGERWYRIWNLFLAWSARIGAQGNAACFQVLANKNLDGFDRRIFLDERERLSRTRSTMNGSAPRDPAPGPSLSH